MPKGVPNITFEQEHDGVIYKLTNKGYFFAFWVFLIITEASLPIVLEMASNMKYVRFCSKHKISSPLYISEEEINAFPKIDKRLAELLCAYKQEQDNWGK